MGTPVQTESENMNRWAGCFSGDYNVLKTVGTEQVESLNTAQDAFNVIGRIVAERIDVSSPYYTAIMSNLLAAHALFDEAILVQNRTTKH